MTFKAPPDPPKALPRASRTDPDVHSLRLPPELSLDVFFYYFFLGQPHAKPHFLRAFLEGICPKIVSKVCVLDGAVMNKSKKHCTGASPKSPSTVKSTNLPDLEFIRGFPGSRRIPRIRCQELLLEPPLPHAPGARMT